MEIFFVVGWISGNTLLFTFWSWLDSTTWFVFSSGMMIAWSHAVWFAPACCIVKPSSWNSTVLEMSPSSVWPSSIASHTAADSTAADQILWWNSGLLFLTTGNANSVTHGLNCTKSPAWSASALISHLLNWITIWPLNSRIKIFWNILKWSNLFDWQLQMLWCFKSTHQSHDILHWATFEIFVFTSFPSNSRCRIDTVDQLLSLRWLIKWKSSKQNSYWCCNEQILVHQIMNFNFYKSLRSAIQN